MALLLVLLFLAVPVAELAVILTVANTAGVVNTIGLLIVVSVVGGWLAKREGVGVYRRVQAALNRGELPNREVTDGFLILLAGALMITPGFLTDCLALLLLFPPSRAVARGVLMSAVAKRGRVAVVGAGRSAWGGATGRRTDDGVWDVDSWENEASGRRPGELGGRP
jgi:UPF0716 protein FxsA